MTVNEYLNQFAHQLVHELRPIVNVKEVTANSEILGAYTEAAVRSLIRRMVHPMHVSTGAVLDYPMPATLHQLDVIVWAPFPAPGIFHVGDFALVPRSSAFGVLEVKRSSYGGVEEKIEAFVAKAPELVAAHGGSSRDDPDKAFMAVIGVLDNPPSRRLVQLMEAGHALAIFERDGESREVHVRHSDVICLVNFLHYVSWRYRVRSAQPRFPEFGTS